MFGDLAVKVGAPAAAVQRGYGPALQIIVRAGRRGSSPYTRIEWKHRAAVNVAVAERSLIRKDKLPTEEEGRRFLLDRIDKRDSQTGFVLIVLCLASRPTCFLRSGYRSRGFVGCGMGGDPSATATGRWAVGSPGRRQQALPQRHALGVAGRLPLARYA